MDNENWERRGRKMGGGTKDIVWDVRREKLKNSSSEAERERTGGNENLTSLTKTQSDQQFTKHTHT